VSVARVPASSANLGPGFDALGMALTLYAEIGTGDEPADGASRSRGRARRAGETHPADVAFRRAGGHGPLWVRSPIPAGRGLGFSGAMRVGGLAAAWGQRNGTDPEAFADARADLLALAIELEGHADNVAASLYGGVVATAAGRAVPVPLALEPAVVTWVPSSTTSTEKSRAALPHKVAFDDAVFNVGRTALLVAALAAGDVDALVWATADRLHQDVRLVTNPRSHDALASGLEAGAWCGWLSGSGPAVALLCGPEGAEALAAALPSEGRARVLAIDHGGATIT
jgi:homoserine kinase